MKKVLLMALLLIPILVVMACAQATPQVTLPKDAQKLSDVVPAMGEHWTNPKNMPMGPIYLVYKGKVIGLEYMYTEKDLMDMSIPTPAGLETFKSMADMPVGATINHVDIGFLPKGHEGYTVAHWDLHLYFISPAEKKAIKP
ncbi:MAG: hypothetical protein HY529_04515 [Chloroflexi bacterium]|nr:hypothetical protein [Chloroflexota bacterium]